MIIIPALAIILAVGLFLAHASPARYPGVMVVEIHRGSVPRLLSDLNDEGHEMARADYLRQCIEGKDRS